VNGAPQFLSGNSAQESRSHLWRGGRIATRHRFHRSRRRSVAGWPMDTKCTTGTGIPGRSHWQAESSLALEDFGPAPLDNAVAVVSARPPPSSCSFRIYPGAGEIPKITGITADKGRKSRVPIPERVRAASPARLRPPQRLFINSY